VGRDAALLLTCLVGEDFDGELRAQAHSNGFHFRRLAFAENDLALVQQCYAGGRTCDYAHAVTSNAR
jgi:hypothetical protein